MASIQEYPLGAGNYHTNLQNIFYTNYDLAATISVSRRSMKGMAAHSITSVTANQHHYSMTPHSRCRPETTKSFRLRQLLPRMCDYIALARSRSETELGHK